MIEIITTVDIYYDESASELVKGEGNWGSNPNCWLYIPKGSIGELDGDEMWFEGCDVECGSLNKEWYEVLT